MEAAIIVSIISMLGSVLVAIIGLVGIRMQTKSKEKQDNIAETMEKIRKENNENVERLSDELSHVELGGLKRFLVGELTEAKKKAKNPRLTEKQKENILNEEQKRLIHEAKDRYNVLGGDSYVDSLYEDVEEMNVI